MSMDALMEKLLKTEEPTMYDGQEIVLRTLTYRDDLILGGLLVDVARDAALHGMSQDAIQGLRGITGVLVVVKFAACKKVGNELQPVFPTMEDIYYAANKLNKFVEIQRLFDLYNKALELSRAEKKS